MYRYRGVPCHVGAECVALASVPGEICDDAGSTIEGAPFKFRSRLAASRLPELLAPVSRRMNK